MLCLCWDGWQADTPLLSCSAFLLHVPTCGLIQTLLSVLITVYKSWVYLSLGNISLRPSAAASLLLSQSSHSSWPSSIWSSSVWSPLWSVSHPPTPNRRQLTCHVEQRWLLESMLFCWRMDSDEQPAKTDCPSSACAQTARLVEGCYGEKISCCCSVPHLYLHHASSRSRWLPEKTINAAVAPAKGSGGVTVVEAGLLSPTVIPV